MDLRQIRYFIAVAEDEHFGRAAERIHIAQPALSRQIQLLETELGLTLFDRLPRGVRLSAAGRLFRDHCSKIVADLGHAVIETQALARGESGVLKLGFIEVAAWEGLIPRSITEFRRAHPDVRLALSAMSSLDQIEGLFDGRIDGGFLYNPPNDPLLSVLAVARHTVVLAVPQTSDFSGRESVDVSELAGQPLISFHRRRSPALYDSLFRGLVQRCAEINIVQEAENEAEMLALVTSGLGFALVNECQRWRTPQGIALVNVTGVDAGLELSFVCRANQRAASLKRFIALLDRTRSETNALRR